MSDLCRIPQLDALRGVAILAVLFAHVGMFVFGPYSQWKWGGYGVDLFFILSGYLITSILLRDRDQPGYFRNFYARRALRIWPLYFLVLVITLFTLPATVTPRWAYVFLLQNNFASFRGPIGITWSLAIEEQFYLVWPLLVYLLPRRMIGRLAILIFIWEPVGRYLFRSYGDDFLHFNTITRLDGLALGALLAVCVSRGKLEAVRALGYAGLPLGAAILAASLMFHRQASLYTGVDLILASVVAMTLAGTITPRARWLEYTGTISYGMYLLHDFIFELMNASGRVAKGRVAGVLCYLLVGFPLTYAAATISWHLFELPINRFKRYFESATQDKSSKPEFKKSAFA